MTEAPNLTVRQACSYLTRRSTCHARSEEHLKGQLEMIRCHYNFLRPHRALKFGKQTKTPVMQAGLASERLSFREVFLRRMLCLLLEHFRFLRKNKLHPGAMPA